MNSEQSKYNRVRNILSMTDTATLVAQKCTYVPNEVASLLEAQQKARKAYELLTKILALKEVEAAKSSGEESQVREFLAENRNP